MDQIINSFGVCTSRHGAWISVFVSPCCVSGVDVKIFQLLFNTESDLRQFFFLPQRIMS